MQFGPLRIEDESAVKAYLAEYAATGEKDIPAYFGKPDWSFERVVRTFAEWSRGENLGTFVPSTTTFARKDGPLVGHYNFRHTLNESLQLHGGHIGYAVRPSERRKGVATRLLAHGMEFGRSLGLPRILVTCEPGNLASSGTIIHNGGVFQDTIDFEPLNCQVSRYWIEL